MAVVTFPDPNVITDDSDNVIVIVYDHWPPSAIAPSDEEPRRGFVNDMLRDIFTAAGYTVIFKSQPVKRGLESVRIGKAHIFSEATPAMLPTLLFPEVPTFAYDGVIWVRMDDPWRYDGAASLRGRRVGNVLGYAARELNDMRGEQFQTEVVEQFLRTIGMFPTGSVIGLSNGNIGVVLEQNPTRPLHPKVMLLLDQDRQPFDKPRILDMQKLVDSDSSSRDVWIEKGHEHGAFGIDPSNYFS